MPSEENRMQGASLWALDHQNSKRVGGETGMVVGSKSSSLASLFHVMSPMVSLYISHIIVSRLL